jgi:hypothetical protein
MSDKPFLVDTKSDRSLTITIPKDDRIPDMLKAIDKLEATVHTLSVRIETLEEKNEIHWSDIPV